MPDELITDLEVINWPTMTSTSGFAGSSENKGVEKLWTLLFVTSLANGHGMD